MRFTQLQMEAFAALSHDQNPLHRDPAYAAQTPFGRVVVYGVCGVLCALGAWAAGRRFALRSLKATFRRPLFLDEEYDLVVNDTGERVSLRWLSNGESRADIRFTWKPWDGKGSHEHGQFSPRAEAADPLPGEISGMPGTLPYAVAAPGLELMSEAFQLGPNQLPPAQIEALCGSSYLIGMVAPGRQALYSEIEMSFADGNGATFKDMEASFDPRFNHVEVNGSGAALASFRLGAFRRPETNDGLDALARVVGRSSRLAGKTAVVTGSSRGFGAVLIKALALQGANVVVHYHEQEESAQRVASELRALTEPLVVRADLSSDVESERFAAEILARFGRVDVLVHSAVPAIRRTEYLAQSASDIVSYVGRSLAVAAGPSRALLTSMRNVPDAVMVSISSVYARDPPPGFVHYAAAKGALEAFTLALAREFPEIAFVVVRPPRLVPDAAGLVQGERPASLAAWAAASPADIATAVLRHIAGAAPGRCEIVDLE